MAGLKHKYTLTKKSQQTHTGTVAPTAAQPSPDQCPPVQQRVRRQQAPARVEPLVVWRPLFVAVVELAFDGATQLARPQHWRHTAAACGERGERGAPRRRRRGRRREGVTPQPVRNLRDRGGSVTART